MVLIKHKKKISLFFIFFLTLLLFVFNGGINNVNANDGDNDNDGKTFETKTIQQLNCYINNENPNLNKQPNVNLEDYILSHAEMNFDNIKANNYTQEIETETNGYYKSESYYFPTYIYQKFWVKTNRYINNVSIFIQDDGNPYNYEEETSWEIAIVNCSKIGTPNPNATLGQMLMPHPITSNAQWLNFNFSNTENGPVFLDTTKTNWTKEEGIVKFWFALRIKMPPDDSLWGGGEKYLYFNIDGSDPSDNGVGDTFATFPFDIQSKKTFENYVNEFILIDGSETEGTEDSFNETDEDRYKFSTDSNKGILNVTVDFTGIAEAYLDFIQNNAPEDVEKEFGIPWDTFWDLFHPYVIYGFDFNIAINVSNAANIQTANMFIFNQTGKEWVNVTSDIEFMYPSFLTKENEELITIEVRDKEGKEDILSFMQDPEIVDYNLTIKFNYTDNGNPIDVSINEVTVDFLLLEALSNITQFDPAIQELYYPINGETKYGTGQGPLEALRLNDNKFYTATSETNNLSIEFEFNLAPYIDSSLWDVAQYDYKYLYPNPVIPKMILQLSSNVSIQDRNNLSLACLEVYIGNEDFPWVPQEYEDDGWFPLFGEESMKLLATKDEWPIHPELNESVTWIILQFINSSGGKNSLKMRLRYEWNGVPPLGGFNVSIDEFSFIIFVQNAKSSDITSKIGYGLNNNVLKPSDITMEVLGDPVLDDGTWEANFDSPSDGDFEFEVTSLWNSIYFDASITYDIYQYLVEIEFEDDLKPQYMIGTNHFSVEVTYGDGDSIEDLEIIFELLNKNGDVIDEDIAITNEDGIAKGALEFEEIGEEFSIVVRHEEEGIYVKEEIESDDFRVVDEFTLFLDGFLLMLPFILATLAGIAIFVAIRHYKMKKLREFWGREALILEDLLKINYILIIHKDAGVTIYDKQISLELDSDLIGGFITAISQFRSEIKKPKKELETGGGFEMDYYDFKIDMIDGDFIRTALILDGAPSEKLKLNQKIFTEDFEKKFASYLGEFDGNVKPFMETDGLIEKFFNISLMYPLQLGKNWKFAKLTKLETALIETAEQMENERKYFFVSSLLNYGLAGRKESKNQIISTIIKLKRRGILVPIKNFENL